MAANPISITRPRRPQFEQYWTLEETAARLRTSRSSVKRWIGNGRLERVYAGDKPLIAESSIQRFLAHCTAGASHGS